MEYSKVKFGEKEAYVFDLIMHESEDWLRDNLLDKLEASERWMFDVKTALSPATNIEIDANDFMKILEPYMEEPFFKTQLVLDKCEKLKESISDFNEKVKVHYSHDKYMGLPFFGEGNKGSEITWYPSIDNITDSLRTACSYFKQKFKKGKCTKEELDSAEHVKKDIIPVIKEKFKKIMDDYAMTFHVYVAAIFEWIDTYKKLLAAYDDFCKEVHPTTELTFGKHRGKNMRYVIIHDLSYAEWLLETKPEFEITKDDLKLFIEKTGYDPYENQLKNDRSDDTFAKLLSFFEDNNFFFSSALFQTSEKPDVDVLEQLGRLFPHVSCKVEKDDVGDYYFRCTWL